MLAIAAPNGPPSLRISLVFAFSMMLRLSMRLWSAAPYIKYDMHEINSRAANSRHPIPMTLFTLVSVKNEMNFPGEDFFILPFSCLSGLPSFSVVSISVPFSGSSAWLSPYAGMNLLLILNPTVCLYLSKYATLSFLVPEMVCKDNQNCEQFQTSQQHQN